MSRQLLEDIRSQLLGEKTQITLSDREMQEVAGVISKAIGKKADYRMGDSDVHTGAIDFGGHGEVEIFVGSKSEGSGKLPYKITVESVDGGVLDNKTANDYKSMLKVVAQLARKHKKGMTTH